MIENNLLDPSFFKQDTTVDPLKIYVSSATAYHKSIPDILTPAANTVTTS
jgi:hypothetical protein